jgi:hypothetical protein
MTPRDLLDFIELPVFTRRWNALGLNDEEDLTTLQLVLMANPASGRLIQGTRSIRKLRYTPPRWRVGKRGATRVLYVYLEEFGIVVLCLIYAKGEVDDLSPAVKKQVNQLVERVERELKRRAQLRQRRKSGGDR